MTTTEAIEHLLQVKKRAEKGSPRDEALNIAIDALKNVMTSTERLLTTHEVAGLLQIDPSSVVKWISDGLLHAYRTPGGHRRIKLSELRTFAKDHNMYMSEPAPTSRR